MRSILRTGSLVAVSALLLAACGDDAADAVSGGGSESDRPAVVVTTDILGDVVRAIAADQVALEVLMPSGADPHEFSPSARQADALASADLVIENGAGFEQGMSSLLESVEADGTPVFRFADQIELLPFTGDHEHGEEGDDEHAEEEGGDAHAEEGEDDPHLWTDPRNIEAGVEALAPLLAGLDGVDGEAVRAAADAYLAELTDLDDEVEGILDAVPDEQRVLVTNHEVFGYFAARYGFEVVGAVIPSLSTNASASAADLEALADLIRDEGVPAIFGDVTSSTELAEALASEVGEDVEVVELYSESLGEPGSGADTYLGMMRTNANLIADALA